MRAPPWLYVVAFPFWDSCDCNDGGVFLLRLINRFYLVLNMEAKTFTRHLTGAELIAACELQGFPIQAQKYLNEGSDHIRFGFQHGSVNVSALYSVINGRAFGTYAPSTGVRALDKGTPFSTDDALDGTPWFDALLSFLYVE